MNDSPILAPVTIEIPKDATMLNAQTGQSVKARFVEDYILGNVCALAQFFGKNLARRRVGHEIIAAFRGKKPGDAVTLPRRLAFELWNAASNSDYSGAMAAQMPESWLYAIPETEAPPEPAPAPELATEPPPPVDPNPPLVARADDAAALDALAAAKESKPS